MIDNGRRAHLVIPGVFDGMAGVQGNKAAFAPNRGGGSPRHVRTGTLDGKPALLNTTKDEFGPFWTTQFQVFE